MSEDKREWRDTPQGRYSMKHVLQFKMNFVDNTEADMIEWLEKQPNKSGYIKRLIREDMARQKTE